jgi:hypothetical protein
MDPYTHAAFGWIQLFLADLNHVIGCLPIGPFDWPHRPLDWVGQQPSLHPDVLNTMVCRGQLTRRSKCWRKKHLQPVLHRPRQSSDTCLPVYPLKQHAAPMCNNIMISTPKTQPAVPLEVQPGNQTTSIFIPNSVHIQLDVHNPTNQFASN